MAVPTNAGELGPFAQNAVTVLEEFPNEYKAGERTDRVKTALEVYKQKVAAYETAKDLSRAATQEKDDAKDKLLEALQSTFRFVKGNDEVSNAALERLGVTPRSSHRTPVRVPTEFPVGAVISTDLLCHTVTIIDHHRRSGKGKPSGVTSCEVFVAVADQTPANPEAYRLAAIATRDHVDVTFKAEEGGKTAHYLLRWVNTRGETGPWSPVFSGTIPAV